MTEEIALKLKIASTLGLAALALTLAQPAAAQVQVSQGQQFYQKVCAKCHEAGIGPVLLGRGLPETTFIHFARHGNGPMPAFRLTDIDDATLRELAAYLSKSAAPDRP